MAADFSGGQISSDGGSLFLMAVDRRRMNLLLSVDPPREHEQQEAEIWWKHRHLESFGECSEGVQRGWRWLAEALES